MENEILEILKRLESKVDKLNSEVDHMRRDVNQIEMITAKNWGDVIRLKRWRDEQQTLNASEDLEQINGSIAELKGIVRENCFDIAELKGIVKYK